MILLPETEADPAMDRLRDSDDRDGDGDGSGAAPDRTTEDIPDDQEIDFVTLGMFIIDEIEFPPPKPPVYNVLGGAGSFSALGARIFSPPPSSKTVGWIVDQGSDFPPAVTNQINSWRTSALFRHDSSRLTTRGWNGYTSGDHRAFRYTTPKLRLTATDLTPPLLRAKAIHLICSPTRCQSLITDLLARRKACYAATTTTNNDQEEDGYTRPLIIWEPVPDLCIPTELLNCTNTLPLVDICSPNHAELAGFLGNPTRGVNPATGAVDTHAVERGCEQLLASMPLQSYTLVVRAGDRGCFVARNGGRKKKVAAAASGPTNKQKKKRRGDYIRGGLQPDTDMEALFAGLLQDEEGCVAREEIEMDPGVEKWVPAYYGAGGPAQAQADGGVDVAQKVVDPTGGGNTFLGGLAVALARGRSIEEACAWGHVAASFAIEQVGFPVLSVDEEGRETWNGERVENRLRAFQEGV